MFTPGHFFRVKIWRDELSTPYPWRFSIFRGEKEYLFAGIPNKCETEEEVVSRALSKLEMMARGEFEVLF